MIPLRDDQRSFTVPFINYFLIILNTAIFLFEVSLSFQSHGALNSLLYQFGIVPRTVTHLLTGDPVFNPVAAAIPMLTSMFLHGSWLHLIGNMWVLWIFGDNVEDHLGHFTYLVFYLVCGLSAGATHILLNLGSRVPSIGASGAIAGIMGAYFVLFPRARVLTWLPPIFFFHLPAWLVLGYWFLLQFMSGASSALTATAETAGIAFWAHVGGFVAGILLIRIFPERPQRYRYGTW